MSSHKPQGYTTVSPYLIVDGASATIDFLRTVFGAVELRRFPDASGKVMHAEVRIDDTVVMLADGGDAWPPIPSYVHVYVRDVDATYASALEAGATSVQAPVKKDDEDMDAWRPRSRQVDKRGCTSTNTASRTVGNPRMFGQSRKNAA